MIAAIEQFLAELNQEAEARYVRMCRSIWEAAVNGTETNHRTAAAGEAEYRRLFSLERDLKFLEQGAEWIRTTTDAGPRDTDAGHDAAGTGPIATDAGPHPTDPGSRSVPPGVSWDTYRQIEILLPEFRQNLMDQEELQDLVNGQRGLEQMLRDFRAVVSGRSLTHSAVAEALHHWDSSPQRQAVWEAAKEVGAETARPLLDLVRRRNRFARRMGQDDYYRMSLRFQEIDPDGLQRLCDRFEKDSDAEFASIRSDIHDSLARRFHIRKEEIRPWHYADLFSQEAPEELYKELDPLFRSRNLEDLVQAFFEGIGLPLDQVLRRSDLYERAEKDPFPFSIHMDRAGDVRILACLHSTLRWAEVFLHECGHAAYELHLDPNLPFSLRCPAHPCVTEGVANLMGRQARDPDWMHAHLEIPAGLDGKIREELPRHRRAQLLCSTRWMLVMIRFESELYRDPDQDLNRLWWDLVERYQRIVRPDNRNRPDWATKSHLISYPVYYHNYLLGELLASQLRAALAAHTPEAEHRPAPDTAPILTPRNEPAEPRPLSGNPQVGVFLRERIFAHGARHRWDDLIRRATGKDLDPHWLLSGW